MLVDFLSHIWCGERDFLGGYANKIKERPFGGELF